MNPITQTPPQSAEEQILRYGYRDVYRRLPNGEAEIDRVPLTLEDLLHPQFGDVPMISSLHDVERDYLADVFRSRLANVPTALVLSDTMINWVGDTEGMRHHSPDISIILDVHEERDDWPSFNVAEQGTRPAIIIEIVSPAYRENDTVTKVDHYLRCRVPCYVIVDREEINDVPRLIGRVLRGNAWRPLLPNDNGWLWLDAVGVYLGVENGRVRCFDATTLAPLGDYTEIAHELALNKSQIITERQLRERAEAKAEQADEARQREAEARRIAEAHAAELEAQLEALQGKHPPVP
jgi:colicin import membrane protein